MAVNLDAGSRVRDLEKRSKEEPKNSELAVTLGEACLRENRVEDAAQAYARSAELDPRSELKSLYWEWLGGAREARGELEEALEAYFNWAEAEPGAVEPLDRVGSLLVRLQRWTDIVLLRPHYLKRREVSADPRMNESLALFGFVLDQLGSPEDVSPLERTYAALEADSRSVSMRYLLGVLFYRTDHLEAARTEFERVLELDVDGTWREERFSLHWDASAARLMLARIARLQGDPDEALAQLSESLKSRADDSERLEEVTSLLLDYRRYKEALTILPELGEATPGWVHQYRAEGLLGLGRVREAEASFLSRLEPIEEDEEEAEDDHALGESNGKHQSALARAEEELGKGRPQAALQRLDKLEGDHWQLQWARARALSRLERWEQAVEQLEILLQHRPGLEAGWELLADGASHLGKHRLSALARVQRERLRGERALPAGVIYPLAGDGPAGFLVQARSLPGKGDLIVTGEGGPGVAELARLAQTLLKTRFESLGLEDPAYRALHLHVAFLFPRGSEPNGRSRVEPEDKSKGPTLGEEAGAAMLAAMAQALTPGERPSGQVVLGRLDLEGNVQGPVELAEPLASLQSAGYVYRRLILPQAAAPDLLRTPPALWLLPQLVLADSVDGLVQGCLG